jgi:L-gulonate 5-dehydrogenase
MVTIAVDIPHHLVLRDGKFAFPGPNEVMVEVRRAGICGSDMHILHGTNPFARDPRVIGHEMAGVVVGKDVRRCTLGDHVVVDPVVACGRCYPCRVGRPNVCANLQVFGVHRDGFFRDRLVVP